MATGLATRCSACGTVFRVVPDQLRVSEGWVRCGRCAEVFNASEALLDLETGAPLGDGAEHAPRAMVQFSAGRPLAPTARAAGATDPVERPAAAPTQAPRPAPPGPGSADPDDDASLPTVDDRASRLFEDAADPAPITPPPQVTAGSNSVPDIAADPQARSAPTPRFMRQAERAERWRQPRVRAVLLATGGLATLALAAQVLFEYRDLASARYPTLRPLLEQACAHLDCSVGPPRAIDSLVVESSGLVRVEKSDVYRLSVALRNRAGIEVALPALELSLTDGQGQLVARRVLRLPELGIAQPSLPAGRELQVSTTLQAATAPVAGYTIELFYP